MWVTMGAALTAAAQWWWSRALYHVPWVILISHQVRGGAKQGNTTRVPARLGIPNITERGGRSRGRNSRMFQNKFR